MDAFAPLGRLVAPLLLAVALLAVPSVGLAGAQRDAALIHVGPSGLESYNAWTKASTTLVHGMVGTWGCPVLSPHGLSAVTIRSGRSDRAYCANMYASVISPTAVPFEITFPDADGWVAMTSVKGWLDDYTVVIQQVDPNDRENGAYVSIARDVRTGGWSYYDGVVTYPASWRPATRADKAYTVAVSRRQVMTVRVRKTKKLVAHFKVPGAGDGRAPTGWYYAGSSISPDAKFIAYELWCTPVPSAYVTWRTYVCTLGGKKAVSLKSGDGGFVWK